jgi:RimJ/RimL family protein N-acetyltransferase
MINDSRRRPIHLRPIELADTERVHSWAADPRSSRFQAWGPNTEEETRDFVAAAVAAWQADPQVRFQLCAVDDGLVVGAGEIEIINRRFGRGEISYIVHPELWGRGYATKIATALVAYGFEELGLHRIQGTCDPRNLASAAVLRKAGLRHEGLMRGTMKIRDGWRDSELFAILAID